MEALKRYAQFYNIAVREELEKEEVAAVIARHFDCTLEVEEDDSIVSFIQRLRNGERNPNAKRALSDKERKLHEKKRKKSNSRKRQRDNSTAAPAVSSSGGAAAAGHGSGSGAAASGGREGSSHGTSEDRKPPSSVSAGHPNPSNNSSHKPTHKKSSDSKKKGEKDNGEDNELYCICNLPSYGNMIACDGKKCPNPSQWYHLECVGFSDGRHPDTWLCPECDPKGFAAFQSKKKKSNNNKQRSKSPGSSK